MTVCIESPTAEIVGRLDALLAAMPAGGEEVAVIVRLAPYDRERYGQPNASYELLIQGRHQASHYGWLSGCEDVLLSEVNRWALDDEAERLHLHAGLVEHNGAGILLVGPSGSGKSTLTAHLVRAGWTYHTDEMVGFDVHRPLLAHSFPRPVSLKEGSWGLFAELPSVQLAQAAPAFYERVNVPPAELGPVRAVDGAEVRAIVFVSADELTREGLVTIGPSEAIERLVADTLDLERAGPAGFGSLVELATRVGSFRLQTRSLGAAEAFLRKLAEEAVVPSVRAIEVSAAATRPPRQDRDDCPRRAAHATGWMLSDGAVIYDHERGVLARLDPTGADVWQRLDGRQPLAEFDDAAIGLVGELASAGLVEIALPTTET